jgi:hypothetical protein
MKKLLILLIFTTLGCSNNTNPKTLCYDLEEDLGKLFLNEKLFTGSCYTVYPDTEDKDEIRSYKKGIMHGVWSKYYPNGKITYTGKAKNGEISGYYKKYRADGILAEEGRMKLGHKDKVWKYYDLAGNLEKKERYEDEYLIDEAYTNPEIQKYIDENKK